MKERQSKSKKGSSKAKDKLLEEEMVEVLRAAWQRDVYYSCSYCLREAYESVVGGYTGYVTDEELIEASNNTLQHK